MDLIFPYPGHIAPPSLPAPSLPAPSLPALTLPGTAPVSPLPATELRDRISRLIDLSQEDTVAGLLWLAMNFPAVCDAMLDKTECDAIDDEDPCHEPEPFCGQCDAPVGIILHYGTDWLHYHGDGITQIDVFDPGHDPVIAWHLPGISATR